MKLKSQEESGPCRLCGRTDGELESFYGPGGAVTGRVHIDPCPKSLEEAFLDTVWAMTLFKAGRQRDEGLSGAIAKGVGKR